MQKVLAMDPVKQGYINVGGKPLSLEPELGV